MKRAMVLLTLLLLVAILPSLSFTEDQATVQLARTVYAIARDEGYDAKLAVASVALNRVSNPWYAKTLSGVLAEKHQFPAGERYDAESLRAAHAVLSGDRSLPEDVLYYQLAENQNAWGGEYLYKTIGNISFYTRDGNR